MEILSIILFIGLATLILAYFAINIFRLLKSIAPYILPFAIGIGIIGSLVVVFPEAMTFVGIMIIFMIISAIGSFFNILGR